MFDQLLVDIEIRAVDAGFTAKKLQIAEFDELEIANVYWESNFASILLINLMGLEYSESVKKIIISEALLDKVLVGRERSGIVIDGYLILAVDSEMHDLKSFIADAEKNTRFVRKHVVVKYPDQWQRVERVTSLGIATVASVAQFTINPTLDPKAKKLMDEIELYGSLATAEAHSKEWNLNE
jgi:hypothetical protein